MILPHEELMEASKRDGSTSDYLLLQVVGIFIETRVDTIISSRVLQNAKREIAPTIETRCQYSRLRVQGTVPSLMLMCSLRMHQRSGANEGHPLSYAYCRQSGCLLAHMSTPVTRKFPLVLSMSE